MGWRVGIAVLACAAAGALAEPRDIAVVFNENDPASVRLASYYAGKRKIPLGQLVGLRCSGAEEITRAEYEATIAGPLRETFVGRGWWRMSRDKPQVAASEIRFVAVIRGVPLKIAHDPQLPPSATRGPAELMSKNEASVDSELAALGFGAETWSATTNPYFRSFRPIGELPIPQLLLVCRLDAPTAETVQRMIDDAVAAEREGLEGFCYADTRGLTGGGLQAGDQWISAAAAAIQRDGFPVVLDNGEAMFSPAYPMRRAALYFGWYSPDVGGPIAAPDFRFERGAVAYHIHSFSAGTLRSGSHAWAGPLLERGAAVTMGNVYEPFLPLTPRVDAFYERLRAGMTFAESAYAAQPALSWMTVFVGDPLYRPFRLFNDLLYDPVPGEWSAYREGARLWFSKGRAAGEKRLAAAAGALESGVVAEGLGLLQASAKDIPSAVRWLRQAGEYYRDGGDRARVLLHEVNLLRFNGQKRQALTRLRAGAKRFAGTRWEAILVETDRLIDPPPPPPTPVPSRSPARP
jgi:uncharacterized protein (TIGR03790 family)